MPGEIIFGRNSVEEALSEGIGITKIWLTKSAAPKYLELEQNARKQKIPVFKVDTRELERIIGAQERSYNIAAELSATRFLELNELKDSRFQKVLFAVNIEDPHNLGALIRSARAFDVDAVIIPNRNAAPVSPVVVAASAGAALTMPIVRVSSVQHCIEKLKDFGYWLYGTDVRGESSTDFRDVKYDSRTVILMGNEHKGMGPAVTKACDFLVHIPCKFESLNVSVAAGIILSELYSQKAKSAKHG